MLSVMTEGPTHTDTAGAKEPIAQEAIDAMSFEEALKALETAVRQLESGDVALDESIALYERGEALRKACQSRLDAAQERIEKIVANADGSAAGTADFEMDR
jgi:exodeoxyribonuclease VII small subunit